MAGAPAPPLTSLPWQQPNNTEGTAWERLRDRGEPSAAGYLPFPWASWIDGMRRGLLPPGPPLRAEPPAVPVASVGQHIWALEHVDALRAAGVTDLFWSHATQVEHHHGGVRIHPFPLFPVRCHTHPADGPPLPPAQRPLLYAYQGFHPPQGYLSEVRAWLLSLPQRPDALVEARPEWHFEQQVYREQVHGLPGEAERHRRLAADARSYVETLRTCCFALCPSGAGPNSIRLWEALGFGAIPVILSGQLRLPGDPDLWRQAALFVPESAEAVAQLPGQLEKLRGDAARLAAMRAAGERLWRRYGPDDFVSDVAAFLAEPDPFLRACALRRLACDDPCELVGREPEALPLAVQRWLRTAGPDTPLLLRIEDARPPALQELLWGTAMRLTAGLLGARPDIRWQVCCRAPAIEALADGAQRLARSTVSS